MEKRDTLQIIADGRPEKSSNKIDQTADQQDGRQCLTVALNAKPLIEFMLQKDFVERVTKDF